MHLKIKPNILQQGLTVPLLLAMLCHIGLFFHWQLATTELEEERSQPITIHLNLSSAQPDTVSAHASSPSVASMTTVNRTIHKRTISAALHQPNEADYLSRWQKYVEDMGNINYPEKAMQQQLRGQLRLLVAINRDGSLNGVAIRQSSGHPLLDQAAIQIVKQAAPFEPLPEQLQDLDILEIIRTWQFNGDLQGIG